MTGFTEQQIADLAAPLARAAVKSRKQAGREVSYLEGWHVIAEANRIFGFDGWDRETIECRCVSEKPCIIGAGGQYEKPGFRVAYVGKVRVTVRAGERVMVREGTGYGSGIDQDVGEAHESAAKECETDALKRCLMTFGNPFGLALYDKTQAEVEPLPQRGAQRPASDRYAPRPQHAAQQASPPQAPTGRAPDRAAQEQAMREGAAVLPVNPEEPPEVAEARRAARAHFWTREHYGIDPAVIPGGMARWDAEMIAQAQAAQNLDQFVKLKQDNREAGFVSAWESMVAKPVVNHFRGKMLEIEKRLSGGMGAAA